MISKIVPSRNLGTLTNQDFNWNRDFLVQGGPLLVISGVITLVNGLING